MIRYRRHAYIRQDLSWLKSYLSMSDEQEVADLVERFPVLAAEQLWQDYHDHDRHDNIEQYESANDFAYRVDEVELAALWDQTPADAIRRIHDPLVDTVLERHPTHAPSYTLLQEPAVINNQWLIHFTKEPNRIQTDGFTVGVDDLSRLGLTRRFDKKDKPGGYNFAFTLDDAPDHAPGYGRHAMLFRASGLRVFHLGDQQYQVVFWGQDATDIVRLDQRGTEYYEDEIDWAVVPCGGGSPVFVAADLATAMRWVVNNFRQYRKVLTC